MANDAGINRINAIMAVMAKFGPETTEGGSAKAGNMNPCEKNQHDRRENQRQVTNLGVFVCGHNFLISSFSLIVDALGSQFITMNQVCSLFLFCR